MKRSALLPLFLLSAAFAMAQPKERFDIASYTVPADWKKDSKQGVVIYSKVDSSTGGFCVIALYAAEPSTGDAKADFDKEWKDLAVTPYHAEVAPATETQTTADGWKAIAAASAAKKEEINSFIVLTVFSGFGKRTSVLANLNDQSFVSALDQFLGSIRLDTTVVIAPAPDSRIIGQWAKSSGSPPQYANGTLVNLVNAGYHKGQYDLKSDGSYSFHGESQFSSNDFSITVENGSYSVSGDQLTVMPKNGSIKKVDLNGSFKKLEQLSLSPRTYAWQLHYFEGLQQTQLVLSNVNENMLDGGYGGSELFPRSFLYSREYKPEWRFTIN